MHHPRPPARPLARRAARLAACTLALAGAFPCLAQACGVDPIIGEICISAIGFCPQDYVPADGRLLSMPQNQALFSLIGTTYGGTWSAPPADANLAVPDLRGRSVVGVGQSTDPGVPAPVALAQQVGQAEVRLNATQVALTAHAHQATFALAGQATIAIPAMPDSLALNVALPIAKAGGTGKPPAGAVYLAPVGGSAGSNSLAIKGPYAAAAPAAKASLSGRATIAGGAPTDAFTTRVATLTGGSVAVGAPVAPAPAPVPTRSPGLGMIVCVAVNGAYPNFD